MLYFYSFIEMKNWVSRCIHSDEDDPLTVHSYINSRKNNIYKNLIFLSLSQSVVYLMYKLMMMIREYENDFLGIWSYTMFYFACCFGFLLLPSFVLFRLHLQNTLRYGTVLFALLIPILYMKRLETVIPVAILMGFIAAIIRVSQQVYIFRLARILSKISGDDLETIILRFSGIFFSIYRSYETASLFPVSFVPSQYRETLNDSENHCGTNFNFDDYNSLSDLTLPPNNNRSFIANLAMLLIAFLTLLASISFIDSPNKLTTTHLGPEEYSPTFSKTLRLIKNRRLQFLIPMSIFSGYEKIIKSYDYPTAYVGCTVSVPRVIYVNFLGCLAASRMSLSLAPLVELTSMRIMFSIAASVNLIFIIVLLLKSHIGLIGYYAISAMWGLSSAIWDCLLYVLYGMMFPGEELEAYCHLGFWYSLGAFTNLAFIRLVSVSFKLWTAFACLTMAIASVFMIPWIINYAPKKVGPIDDSGNSGTSGFNRQRINDARRSVGVYFGKTAAPRKYNRGEIKSISTSRIHRVAIPKTRTRFDRRESSNEDI